MFIGLMSVCGILANGTTIYVIYSSSKLRYIAVSTLKFIAVNPILQEVFEERISHGGGGKMPPNVTRSCGSTNFGMSVCIYQNFFEKLVLNGLLQHWDVTAIFSKNYVIFAITSRAIQILYVGVFFGINYTMTRSK